MWSRARRQIARYAKAGAGTEKLTRHPPRAGSTKWLVAGNESTDQAHECGGSKLVM